MTDGSRITLLEEWMKGKEGENLEFKSARGGFHFEELGKYCCALANEGGGRIILGVTDARPRQVVGTKAFEQPERTRKGLCEKIPLSIDFEEINHPDCAPDSRVLVFNVPPRPLGIPIKYDGRYWMRKEDSLVEMSEERLRDIFAESGHDFSADVCLGLTKKHIDESAAVGARLEDLRQVLPSLPETTVRSLLNTLKLRGEAHSVGRSRGAKWFPGQAPEGAGA